MTEQGILGVKYIVRLGRLFVSDAAGVDGFEPIIDGPSVKVTADWKAAQFFDDLSTALDVARKFYGDVAEVQFNVDRYITREDE